MTKENLKKAEHIGYTMRSIAESMYRVRLHFKIEGPKSKPPFGFYVGNIDMEFIDPDDYLAKADARLAELEKELAEL